MSLPPRRQSRYRRAMLNLDEGKPCRQCKQATWNRKRICRHCLNGTRRPHQRYRDNDGRMVAELPPGAMFARMRRMVGHRRRVEAEEAAIEGRREQYA